MMIVKKSFRCKLCVIRLQIRGRCAQSRYLGIEYSQYPSTLSMHVYSTRSNKQGQAWQSIGLWTLINKVCSLDSCVRVKKRTSFESPCLGRCFRGHNALEDAFGGLLMLR